MTHSIRPAGFLIIAAAAAAIIAPACEAQVVPSPSGWRQHEMDRPRPPAVTPPALAPAPPPADAIVLFDGRDLSAFVTGPAATPVAPAWKIENGYVEVVPQAGSIRSKEAFGDIQLHVEWASPNPPINTAQNRGNSGVILMGQYEIQVLDSYQRSDTYADGQAGSIYGQYPPLVNAARPPGEWQSFDIYFRRPRFNSDGSVAEPARATVVHNGILVQNNEVIHGPTASPPPHVYARHADELPFTLQDHSQPVRFRNIWVRRLGDRPAPAAGYLPTQANLSEAQLQAIVGTYFRMPAAGSTQAPPTTPTYTITRTGDRLMVAAGSGQPVPAIATAPDRLWLSGRASELTLTLDARGAVTAVNLTGATNAPALRRN